MIWHRALLVVYRGRAKRVGMEKKEAAEEERRIRIYVGGLGEKVTDDDLSKIFDSLGKVKAVEIVRTKGRSFGYLDFFPSDDKSLSKLFSTYNGCVWKGGRLRLEKAKEHYLARLKREWAQDAEIASSVEADKGEAPLEKPKKVLDVEKKLNLFFPRLRKVKTLPFSGTGKHKYSFQRVEAHPVPMYFCDCEEHSAHFCAAERKQIRHHTAGEEEIHDLEALGGVINEEELNLMNSVMSKLFERENVSNGGHSGTGLANEEHNSDKLIEDLQIGENEADSVADEDNLVINAVSRGNNRLALSRCQEKTTISQKNKKLTLSETRTSKEGLVQSVPKEQKTNNFPPNKKRKSLHNDETVMAANPVDDVNLQTNTNKSRRPLGAQHPETKSGVRQSTASHLWSQKMSWKALVGDEDSRVFSVSNILPTDAYTEKADNAIDSFGELKFDENESDEDNLIINVVSKKKNKMASRNQEQETIPTMNQKSISNENKTSNDGPIQQKKSTSAPKKKRKSVINEESERKKSVHTIPGSAGSAQTHTNEMEMPTEAQSIERKPGVKQSITDHSESKKPLRRILVGDKGSDESSVSNLFPDNSAKEERSASGFLDVPSGSLDSKIQNSARNELDVPSGSLDSKIQNSARNENLEGKSAETESVEVLVEAQPTEGNVAPNKSGKGSSWFQKSPWTQLVNDSNSSFSITQISPGITFKKQELSKPDVGKEIANPNDKKFIKSVSQATSEPTTHSSTAPEDGKEGDVVSQSITEKNQPTVVGNNEASVSSVIAKATSEPTTRGSTAPEDGKEGDVVSQSITEKTQPTVVGNNEASVASVIANNYESTPRQTTNGGVTLGETCSFMRNAASIKEWSTAKAALSGSQSLKRKSHEK